jgi:AraC family transcriptional regulator
VRAGSIEAYVERISRVIDFVGESVRQRRIPTLSDMAGVAALSEYHFHRIFHLMTGETPAEAVSRVRLSAALGPLELGDLAGAVEASGYATSQALARALKERVGATPSELRADGRRLATSRSSLLAPAVSRSTAPVKITVEIADLKPLRLVARRHVGDFRELNVGYGLLFDSLCEQIDPGEIIGIYGIPWDDPRFVAASDCRFDCAFEVVGADRVTGALPRIDIGAGLYAGLRHLGNHDDIHARIDDLYTWVIQEGPRIANRPLLIQYLDDPEVVAPPNQRSIAWLPLEENES